MKEKSTLKDVANNYLTHTREEKGITLIALIVTIIVLIILAGVTLNIALDNDGIINKTKEAAKEYEKAQIEEQIELAIITSRMGSQGEIDKESLYNELTKITGANVIKGEGDAFPWQIKIKGYEYEITETGEIILKGETTQEPTEIAISQITIANNNIEIEKGKTAQIEITKEPNNTTEGVTYTSNNTEIATVNENGVVTGIGVGETTITIAGQKTTNVTATCTVKVTLEGIGATEVKENASQYYGALVENYTVQYNDEGGTKWRIFYSDGTNIYLIADDYISSNYAPDAPSGSGIYVNSTYGLSFDNVINDYTGASNIESSIGNKWLGKFMAKYPESENSNIKAVAYMLDTSIWNSHYKNDYAEYVIGGPTIEMFSESYKDTHPTNYIECEVTSSNGYQVRWKGGSYADFISGLTQDDYKSIYIKSDNSKANGMWLASPSAYVSDYVMRADYDGYVYLDYYNNDSGFRPLVCLKSEVHLKESTTAGNYIMVK